MDLGFLSGFESVNNVYAAVTVIVTMTLFFIGKQLVGGFVTSRLSGERFKRKLSNTAYQELQNFVEDYIKELKDRVGDLEKEVDECRKSEKVSDLRRQEATIIANDYKIEIEALNERHRAEMDKWKERHARQTQQITKLTKRLERLERTQNGGEDY